MAIEQEPFCPMQPSVHTNTIENVGVCNRKRRFSKMLSKVEDFENGCAASYYGRLFMSKRPRKLLRHCLFQACVAQRQHYQSMGQEPKKQNFLPLGGTKAIIHFWKRCYLQSILIRDRNAEGTALSGKGNTNQKLKFFLFFLSTLLLL